MVSHADGSTLNILNLHCLNFFLSGGEIEMKFLNMKPSKNDCFLKKYVLIQN